MKFTHLFINMLAGYDVLSNKKALEQSITSLTEENRILLTSKQQCDKNLKEKIAQIANLLLEKNELVDSENLLKEKVSNQDRVIAELQTKVCQKENVISKLARKTEALAEEKNILAHSELILKDKISNQEITIEELQMTIVQNGNDIAKLTNYIESLSEEQETIESVKAQTDQTLKSIENERVVFQNALNGNKELLVTTPKELEQANIKRIQLQERLSKSTESTEKTRELENQIQALQEQLYDTKRETEILHSNLKSKEDELEKIGKAFVETTEKLNRLIENDEATQIEILAKDKEIQVLKEMLVAQLSQDNIPVCNEDENPANSNGDAATADNNEGEIPADSNEETSTLITYTREYENNLQNIESSYEYETELAPNPHNEKPETNNETDVKETRTHKAQSTEEDAVEQSGNSMINFPPIFNDSNKVVQRSIEFVYDKEGKKIAAASFFGGKAEEIARKSRELEEAGLVGKSDFVCGMCYNPVRIGHRTINGRESLFFTHANRNETCVWKTYSTSSNDSKYFIDELSLESEEEKCIETEKSRIKVLKEIIFSILCSPQSEEMGITDVKCDSVIRSTVPYMKWRRPDISFKYHERDIVIILQRKKYDLRMLVDRDVFFRLNNHQVIWVFGADNDANYDYMRLSNYKNTLFDCHRNVFVFDKEAQERSEETGLLCLKYNWLNEKDKWAVNLENNGCNGLLADITSFTFDDEYCKPYIIEANEPYFKLHPIAEAQYRSTKKSREQLLKEFEARWKGEPSYEEALRDMKVRKTKVIPFMYMELWGIRYKTTTLIQPIFTEQPIDLQNGYYMVKQNNTVGVVNYFGEVVMGWNQLESERLIVVTEHKQVIFQYNKNWGVADFDGNVLIEPKFSSIQPWSETIYRVNYENQWGLFNTNNREITSLNYDSIGLLKSGKAEATRHDKDKIWVVYKGYLDESGREVATQKIELNKEYSAVEIFENWGVCTNDDRQVTAYIYQQILPWYKDLVKVKQSGKWGIS